VLIGQNSQNFYLFDNLPGSQVIRKPTATPGQTVLDRFLQIRLTNRVDLVAVISFDEKKLRAHENYFGFPPNAISIRPYTSLSADTYGLLSDAIGSNMMD
jgi:hypothetical protein